jgi:hypothetical protein
MKLTELKKLIRTLRLAGVTRFKSSELELDLGPLPVALPVEPRAEIPHVVEEMKSVMKISDIDLIDRLFPDSEKPEGTEQ